MPTGELVLQVWAALLGFGFLGFYYHPRFDRHPSLLWASLVLFGYAISRNVYLRLPDGFVRSALLVGQFLFVLASGYTLYRVFRFVGPLLKQRFGG